MVPVVEEEPVQQSRQLPEEGHSGAVAKAEGAVAGIKKLQGRMQEKVQNVEGGEQIGEMALHVSKIMLEVVAPELEGLDVLIFDFPSCPSGEGQGDERVGGEWTIWSYSFTIRRFLDPHP